MIIYLIISKKNFHLLQYLQVSQSAKHLLKERKLISF